jgi:hypothetical protein
MQLPPASVMANWPAPNYENPVTQGLPLIIVNVIFMALISLALPLRLYSRYSTKGRLGWDDFNMTIAYVLLTQSNVSIHLLIHAYRCWVWPSALSLSSPTFASSGIVIYGMSNSQCSSPRPVWHFPPSFYLHSLADLLALLSFVSISASSKTLETVYSSIFFGQHSHTTLRLV